MMQSSNRIPKEHLQISQKMISVNNELMAPDDLFEKTVVQKQIEESKQRIFEEEAEARRAIEENEARIFEEAKQAGYEEGMRIAVEKAKTELRQELQETFDHANSILAQCNDRLKTLIVETNELRNQYLVQKKDEVVDLIFSILKNVSLHAASQDPNVFEEIYADGISQLEYSTRDLFIRVHPQNEAIIKQFYGEELPSRVHLLPDLSLGALDFILETDREFIDVTLENRLKRIEEGVRRIVHDQQ